MLQKSFNLKSVFALLLASSLFSAAHADIGLEIGFGLDTSGDKLDAVEKAYGTKSSGLGMFLEMQAGMQIGVNENVVIKPELSYLFGLVKVEYLYGDNVYIDSILIPAIAAEYYVNDRKGDSFFVGANIGYPIPSSGSGGVYEFEQDGMSYGIYGGYIFGGNSKISLGYRSIPVKTIYANDNRESANFGGVSLKIAYIF
ncbi:MAG: hypothetical protein LBG21_02475 [Campylobacteraceae bacterium]|jgi:hypothetical protein|nr:hypothetical protein [Campylobacteraceae bacterium]